MSNMMIAFLFSLGASTWIYSKFYRRTGGQNQMAVPAAAACGLILFIIAWTMLETIFG